jgi:hypothetical protein
MKSNGNRQGRASMKNTANTDSKQPINKQELIAANIKLLIDQLEAGKSDALTAYLTAMSRFHNYSFGNVLEIARQRSDATHVAGFWTWKNLGRNVKAGQKGIRILAPIVGVRRKKDKEPRRTSPSRTTASCSAFGMPMSSISRRQKALTFPTCTRFQATPARTSSGWPR